MASVTLVTVLVVLLLLTVAGISIARTAPRRREVQARPHGSERASGLPPGRIVYADDGASTRPLVARTYPLLGKPDYVVLAHDGRRIPVEIKSARVGRTPRHEDVLQVVTYLLILDDLYEPAPRYGLLRYANATFEIPFTVALRNEVLDLLAEMQSLDGQADAGPPPGEPDTTTCRACAFQAICEDAAVY